MHIIPYTTKTALRIEGLFQGDRPVPTRLWAILDGTIQGRILVDESYDPTFALVQDLTEGTVYLGGVITPPTLHNAFAIARSYQDTVVCLWPDDPLIPVLPAGRSYEGTAIDFTNRSPTVDLNRLAVLPSGYQIKRITEEIALRITEFGYYVTMYGSLEQASRNMIGYCLMQGETIVSEAIAAPLTRGVAELGAETEEGHRRMGLATITSAYVIRECEARGYRPFWNAAQQNVASVALARRLGFQTEQPFIVLAWSAAPMAEKPNISPDIKEMK